MLIRNFVNINDEDSLLSCGIKQCKRSLMIFVNRTEYDNNTAKVGRAIMINESLADANNNINKMRIANSAMIRVSVYYFDVMFQVVKDVKSAIFTVTEAFSTERQVVYSEQKVLDYEVSQYSNILVSANETVRDMINTMSDTTLVTPPLYYNESHMYNKTYDFLSLFNYDTIQVYTGRELIDNFTTINFYDIVVWDTMNPVIKENLDKDTAKNNMTVGDFSNELFSTFAQSLINDAIYIYDSESINKVNILHPKFPFQQYQLKTQLIKDLEDSKVIFKNACKSMELKFGSVRVQYMPTMDGDKFSIHFRDYKEDNQPLSLIDNKKIMGIDRSYPTVTSINDYITDSSMYLSECE
jgi:hypothetical protein